MGMWPPHADFPCGKPDAARPAWRPAPCTRTAVDGVAASGWARAARTCARGADTQRTASSPHNAREGIGTRRTLLRKWRRSHAAHPPLGAQRHFARNTRGQTRRTRRIAEPGRLACEPQHLADQPHTSPWTTTHPRCRAGVRRHCRGAACRLVNPTGRLLPASCAIHAPTHTPRACLPPPAAAISIERTTFWPTATRNPCMRRYAQHANCRTSLGGRPSPRHVPDTLARGAATWNRRMAPRPRARARTRSQTLTGPGRGMGLHHPAPMHRWHTRAMKKLHPRRAISVHMRS